MLVASVSASGAAIDKQGHRLQMQYKLKCEDPAVYARGAGCSVYVPQAKVSMHSLAWAYAAG